MCYYQEGMWFQDISSLMGSNIKQHRDLGKRKTIVIVAEGAIDRNLTPISAEYVKKVLAEEPLKLDTRITTLGHVQRGGSACAYDRMLATLQGVEAVEAVLAAKPGESSPVIVINENKIGKIPLMDAVKQVSLICIVVNLSLLTSIIDTSWSEEDPRERL